LISIDGHDAEEQAAIKELLSYRLDSAGDDNDIRDDWAAIVEGRHRFERLEKKSSSSPKANLYL
jgi:hypothetical protein